MSAGTLTHGVLSWGVALWMVYQLVRRPSDTRLQALTALVGCWALSWPFGVAASGVIDLHGLDVMTARAIQHILRAGAAFCLVVFFLYAARPAELAARSMRRQAVPLLVAVVVMTLAAAAVPDSLRAEAAGLTSGTGTGPVGVTAIGLFYVTANVYMGHAFTVAWIWTHRRRGRADRKLRRALGVAELGLGCIVLATALLVLANVLRWAGSEPPTAVTLTGVALLLPGFVIFLVAVSYPAVRARLGALRRTLRHRRLWRKLRPLWAELNAVFPDDALEAGAMPAWRERLQLRGITHRYYRRFVECRDGLVRLSPYLAAVGYDSHTTPTAEQTIAALDALAAGTQVADQAITVAPPPTDDSDADVDALAQLSQRIASHRR